VTRGAAAGRPARHFAGGGPNVTFTSGCDCCSRPVVIAQVMAHLPAALGELGVHARRVARVVRFALPRGEHQRRGRPRAGGTPGVRRTAPSWRRSRTGRDRRQFGAQGLPNVTFTSGSCWARKPVVFT
jgi:hypothetical protein